MWWIGPIVTGWQLAVLTAERWLDSAQVAVGDWALKRWYGPWVVIVAVSFVTACFVGLLLHVLEIAARK